MIRAGKYFKFDHGFVCDLKARQPHFGYGLFSESVYRRTYSRVTPDGRQEEWADTIIRVVEGIMTIRKNFAPPHVWNDEQMMSQAHQMAKMMFEMKFLPAGRHLWAMGTQYIYERGGMALANCTAISTKNLIQAAYDTMDLLMCGCGVGM